MSEAWTTDDLRTAAERLMNWEPGDSQLVSFRTLGDLIREKDPELYQAFSDHMRRGRHLIDERRKTEF